MRIQPSVLRSLKRCAYHEAGHAVAFVLTRRRLDAVTIGHQIGGVEGNLRTSTPRSARQVAFICMAGEIAEKRHTRRARLYVSDEDFALLVETGADYDWSRAERRLYSPKVWPAVEALANALMERLEPDADGNPHALMDGKEAGAIIRRVLADVEAQA